MPATVGMVGVLGHKQDHKPGHSQHHNLDQAELGDWSLYASSAVRVLPSLQNTMPALNCRKGRTLQWSSSTGSAWKWVSYKWAFPSSWSRYGNVGFRSPEHVPALPHETIINNLHCVHRTNRLKQSIVLNHFFTLIPDKKDEKSLKFLEICSPTAVGPIRNCRKLWVFGDTQPCYHTDTHPALAEGRSRSALHLLDSSVSQLQWRVHHRYRCPVIA